MEETDETPEPPVAVRTVGHGAQTAESFTGLVQGAGVAHVVDVRSFPASRRHPHFGREALEESLPGAGIAYSWEQRLGGRRRPLTGSRHVGLEHEAFRAYADHMGTAEFTQAMAGLLRLAGREPPGAVAVMCAESLWWKCHRRLLSDALVLLHGASVEHLMPDGRLAAHQPTAAARVEDGRLVYDVGKTGPLC